MTDLLEAMDQATVALLKRVGLGDTTESSPDGITVREQCQVFEATAAYVQWREKAKAPPPAEKPKGKFSGLREQFHGDAPLSRTRRRRPAAVNGDADQTDGDPDLN